MGDFYRQKISNPQGLSSALEGGPNAEEAVRWFGNQSQGE